MFEDQKVEKVDLLNRKPFFEIANKTISYYSKKEESVSFSIEGDWGIGKTWVVDEIYNNLFDIQNEFTAYDRYCIFKYNAWEYDYYNEPLLSLLLSIYKTIQYRDEFIHIKEKHKDKFNDVIGAITEVLIEPIAIAAATHFSGDPTVGVLIGKQFNETYKIIKSNLDDSKSNRTKEKRKINPNYDLDTLMTSTIKALKKISSSSESNTEPRTIVIFIDELDRCLPEYAIKVLERMHHISQNVPNIQMIYSIDRKQLTETIKNYYGNELNVNKYLKKFISFSLKLQSGKINENITKAYPQLFWNFEFSYCTQFDVNKIFSNLFPETDMRERENLIKKMIFINNLLMQDQKWDISILYFETIIIKMKQDKIDLTNLVINLNHDSRLLKLDTQSHPNSEEDKLKSINEIFCNMQKCMPQFTSLQLSLVDYPEEKSLEYITYKVLKILKMKDITECNSREEVNFLSDFYEKILKFKAYYESITID